MNDETAINIAITSVMASALDNDTKQEVIKVLRALEEQQKEIGRLEKYVETLQDVHFTEMQTEKAENDRLRKALEKIGSPIIGSTFADMFELKQIARQALKE
ncbi:hypothetical protein [Siminovitchia sp. FSL W7-1587]|uniref:hypothetical protein n=1 Tax=Siminovitchia sp. FSL W7-1587 TaxID=2954699 RepID=UPI0030D576BF